LFGNHSLHRSIHRSFSFASASFLANQLTNPLQEKEEIVQVHYELQRLGAKAQAVYPFLALSLQSDFTADSESKLRAWLQGSAFRVPSWYPKVLPMLLIGFIAGSLLGFLAAKWVTLLFVLNLLLVYRHNKKITTIQGQLGSVHPSLDKMAAQIKHWQSKLAEGEEAKTWANRQIELKKLARLMARLDARLNPIGAFFANGLFLYDLHTINALADWKKKNGAEVEV